jgi:hypothetical protein
MNVNIRLININNTVKIYINDKLHLRLCVDKITHVHSYNDTTCDYTPYKIEIHGSNTILLEYSDIELWIKILNALDNYL